MSVFRKLRQRRRGAGHNEGFWPGYVDALTNVVLNLLFLVAILAAGVFSMGMEASRKALLSSAQPVAHAGFEYESGRATGEAKSVDVGLDMAQGSIRATGMGQSKSVGAVVLSGTRETQGHVLVTVLFDAQVLVMTSAQRQALQEQLLPRLSATQRKGAEQDTSTQARVWAISDKDPVRQRAAFLRVLAVRDLLLQLGLSAQQVNTRLVDGVNSGAQGQTVYVLLKAAD